jgi:hypothetical protein
MPKNDLREEKLPLFQPDGSYAAGDVFGMIAVEVAAAMLPCAHAQSRLNEGEIAYTTSRP